jgi:hypothetical protein
MKFAMLSILALLTVAPTLMPSLAEAKSAKWSCVNVDPANPSSYVCTSSRTRP